ncbi:MAG: Gfo/Idh/MocA family oxidoreductase [Armatimonadota bacterium]|jgi:predicted dehydrogenase
MQLIVAGAGWAGERHVQAIRALALDGRDVQVAALVDTDAEHLAEKAEQWDIRATHTDLADALEAYPEAEGVVLATPHHVHRAGTEQAAAAGRHVLVEKPMALTLADADAMIAACEAAGVALMVGESVRYERQPMAVRNALEQGEIGEPLSGRIDFIGRGRKTYCYPGRRAWLADPDVCGGGIWMLNGIHTMSLARMLLGEVRRIDARSVRSDDFRSPLEATIVALVDFESGPTATMTVSAELHGYGRFGELVLYGSEGTLQVDWRKGRELAIFGEGREPQRVECGTDERSGAPGSFVRQMEEFLAAVAEERRPATGGEGERQSLAAILAGYESVSTGEPVEL